MSRTAPTRRSAADPLRPHLERFLESGDQEAMEEIVRRTRPRLTSVARRIGAPQDAEDAVQSAYFSLLRKQGQTLDAPVLAWLTTAVVRIAYRQKARKKKQAELARRLSRPREGESPLPEVVGAEAAERLHREVARLPASYRDPVVLRYLEGLSTAETADLLDLSEGAVRTRLHRGIVMLRGRWPAPLKYGLLVVPWFLADAGRASASTVGQALTAGSLGASAVAIAVVAAGVAGTTTGVIVARGRTAPAAVEEGRGAEDIRAELAAVRDRRDGFRRELDRERERIDAITAEAADLRAELARAPSRAESSSPADNDAPLGDFGHPDWLRTVNWNTVGTSLMGMVRLIGETRRAAAEGREVPPELLGRIQVLNGNLVREVVRVPKTLPGTGGNGRFLHPLFMGNAMAAVLALCGLPLSEEQERDLSDLVRRFTDEDEVRVRAYDDRTSALRKLVEETELHERFLDTALAVLTPEQAEAIRPAATRGRVRVDMFSTGVVWYGKVADVPFREPSQLVEGSIDMLVRILMLSSEQRKLLTPLVKKWVEGLPPDLLEPADEKKRNGWFPVREVIRMGRLTDRLLTDMARESWLEKEQRERIRKIAGALYPVRLSED